jgi:hypothetical protein
MAGMNDWNYVDARPLNLPLPMGSVTATPPSNALSWGQTASSWASAFLGDFLGDYGGNYLGNVGATAKGFFYEGPKEVVVGSWNAAMDLPGTAMGLANSIAHPILTGQALYRQTIDTWNSGYAGQGQLGFDLVTTLVGGPAAAAKTVQAIDKLSDLARALKTAQKAAGKLDDIVEEAVDARLIHGNSLEYVGDTHVYRIKGPNGSTYKIGESMQGTRVRDGASIRGEAQARALRKETGEFYRSDIRRTFPDKASARDYETRVVERFRRMFGDDALPGNKTNR